MTTLKSVYEHSPATLTIVNNIRPGEIYFHARPEGDCVVSSAEVLEALDATSNADVKHRADVYTQLNEAEAKLAGAVDIIQQQAAVIRLSHSDTELVVLKAKLAEAEATIERVKDRLIPYPNDNLLKVEIQAALEPPKPFELPTEVPARIEVRHRATNTRDELVLWTDGNRQTWWDAEDSSDYTPEQVMADFTNHRLLDEEP